MLPAFSKPKTNPSVWVTVGSAGKHQHVCAGTYLSFYCLPLLRSLSPSPSFKLSALFVLSSNPLPFLALSLSTASFLNREQIKWTQNITLMCELCTFDICNWSHFFIYNDCLCFRTQNFFFPPEMMWWQCEGPSVWSQASEPRSSQHCCCHTCCHTLFTVHLWATSMQKSKACCKHFKNDIQDACNKTETDGGKKRPIIFHQVCSFTCMKTKRNQPFSLNLL